MNELQTPLVISASSDPRHDVHEVFETASKYEARGYRLDTAILLASTELGIPKHKPE